MGQVVTPPGMKQRCYGGTLKLQSDEGVKTEMKLLLAFNLFL